ALEHDARLFLERADPADPAPDDHADPVAVQAIEVVGEAGILDCLLGDGDGELRESIGPACLLTVEVLLRLEPLHLACEADVEVLGRVELRNGPRPAPAVEQRGPRTRYIVAHGREQPDAGDDDAVSRSVTRMHHPSPRPVYLLHSTVPALLALALVLLQVANGIGDGLELLGLLVRDLDAELLLERHDQLHRIQRIG